MPRMVNLSVVSSTTSSCRLKAEGFMGVTEMDFNVPVDVIAKGIEAWDNGTMVQNAFPMLDADHREFLMTGMLPDQFNAMCGQEG
jgi:hypothetical protein